ncbi:MAG: VWA domain-containing protein [Pirellula sp.]|jgi:hypothetical protein|nr:VWA domain-containing protein [Pirellula sp.]
MIDRTAFRRSLPNCVRFTVVGFGIACLAGLALAGLATTTNASESIVVVLLDDSGSMKTEMRTNSGNEPRMSVAKTALTRVVGQLPAGTKFGLLLMNGARTSQGWLIPLASLDRASALARIDQVRAEGGTPLGQSMKTAMDELLALRSKVPYGDYRLLVVTDGEATDKELLDRYLPDMISRGIVVDVIGVDMRSEHSLAKRTHSYRKANDAASFEKALTEIFAESSSSSSNDDVAADFEMIAGLPDEFATESLKALTMAQNGEIAERRLDAGFTDQNSMANAPIGTASGPVTPTEPKGNSSVFVVVVILIVMTAILSKFVMSNQRR